MNWTFFHKLGSPRWFYAISSQWLPWLSVLTVCLVSVGLTWGLLFTPPDYLQGNSYRIIYLHVPAAFLASAVYAMMAIAAAVSLIWKMKMADITLVSSAPVGASFCFLALVTGAVWGKPTWGTWWVWDARLTFMLILLFLYLGVMALRSALGRTQSAVRACAILTLVGVVNLPIIKYSVEWWNTLHQGATLTFTKKPSMAPDMLWPLLLCIAAFYFFFTVVLMMRMRAEILDREKNTQWVKSVIERT